MMISRPFESTLLIRFASGSRAGVAAGAVVVVGFVERCCGVSTLAESVDGDNNVSRSRKTSKLRFTDNSICWKLMLIVGKRLS